MVSEKEMAGEQGEKPTPVVLSTGAGIALGNVFKRINKQRPARDKSTGKRPRPNSTSVVLAANEEVREVIRDQRREKKRLKEARKAKLQFESNARIIPDAATNAAMEKEFLMTATKGAVALFNAVSKAQKAAEEAANKPKKGGPPISRDSFMNMMRAGVAKGESDSKIKPVENAPDSDKEDTAPKSKAKWLKDDFLTAKSKTLRDWDRDEEIGYEDGSSGSEGMAGGGGSGDGEEDDEESTESSGESEDDGAESGDSES